MRVDRPFVLGINFSNDTVVSATVRQVETSKRSEGIFFGTCLSERGSEGDEHCYATYYQDGIPSYCYVAAQLGLCQVKCIKK